MRVLVTGARGQLGQDVCGELARRSLDCVGVDIEDFDLTKEDETVRKVSVLAPDTVIHCAAWTAVDRAESEEARCRQVNEDGTRHVALACQRLGIGMLYVSTDYVFDGTGSSPFETDATIAPLNVYGKTKAAGEWAVRERLSRFFIVRTSWVYGAGGNNFVQTILRLGKEKESLRVVHDQVGSPTYTRDLARLLCDMVVTDRYGVYHATNEGFCSWSEFAEAIIAEAGLACKVIPVTSDEFPTPARRPMNSRLSKESLDRAGFGRLPHWRDALTRYLRTTGEGSLLSV